MTISFCAWVFKSLDIDIHWQAGLYQLLRLDLYGKFHKSFMPRIRQNAPALIMSQIKSIMGISFVCLISCFTSTVSSRGHVGTVNEPNLGWGLIPNPWANMLCTKSFGQAIRFVI